MYYIKQSLQELLNCYDNDFENNCNSEHSAKRLQEIMNRLLKRVMNIITYVHASALALRLHALNYT